MSDTVRILITGFGSFQDITINPSFEIVKQLPTTLPGVTIIAHPEPIKAAYSSLLQTSPHLIDQHNPDIVLHIGLAVERDYFAVEQSANRDGYHQYPDEDRQVLAKTEGQRIWGKKSATNLQTSLDLEQAVEIWKRNLRSRAGNQGKKGKGHKKSDQVDVADVRLSDDVGDYVCGLLFYATLAKMTSKGDGRRNAVFLHIPKLSGDAELEKGKEVVVALILALAEVS